MAFLKALVLAGVALPLVSAKLPPAPITGALHYPLVHQVICKEGRGTAFRVGPNRMLSVAHVTKNSNCKINGRPFASVEPEGQDFAEVTVADRKLGALPINCDGFQPGEWYWAVGYAGGYEWQTVTRLYATIHKDIGMRLLRGEVIRGMSGGPILNAKGEVVGTVNAKNIFVPVAYSVELADTPVCANA